jgi:hypothetical protein
MDFNVFFRKDADAQMHVNFQELSVIALLIDPDTGKIVDANKVATLFYGYDLDQLLQMRI